MVCVGGVLPLQPLVPQSVGTSEPPNCPPSCPCWFGTPQILSALAQTHSLKLLIGEKTGLAAGREVTEHPEGVSGAALVGINPVLAWEGGQEGQTDREVWLPAASGQGDAAWALPGVTQGSPPPIPQGWVWCPLSLKLAPQNLTVLEVRVAKLQLPADPRGALGGAQGASQLLHLGAQGAERGVHLLQPLVIWGGSLLPQSPFSCSPVPPVPAGGQWLEQLSWAALGWRGMKG